MAQRKRQKDAETERPGIVAGSLTPTRMQWKRTRMPGRTGKTLDE